MNRDAVFVVSGGARGVTARCVVKLASTFQCSFILLGRSDGSGPEPAWAKGCSAESDLKQRAMEHLRGTGERPTPKLVQQLCQAVVARREVQETLSAIERGGGRAAYHSVDVRNLAAMREVLAANTFGPITGLIHGAGQLADKLIENKTSEDFEGVYNTKVAGLLNLLACIPLRQLRHLVLFSSAAGYYGNAGQTDYAMANEILNKIGHQAKALHPECRTIAIDWGPWEGGMVTPEIKQLFEKRGISVIPYEAGAQLLANELGAPTDSAAQIVVGTPFTAPPARIERTQARKHTVRRVLKESDNPFLADHMIGQHAVLPTVCAVAWFANTAEQLYPGYKMFRCEKFKVLKGIVFDEGLAGEYRLDLDEAEPAAGGELAFRGMIASMSAAGHKRPHYSGVFHLRSQPAEPVFTSLEGLASHPEVAGAETLYSDGTLFHGPSFRGVRRILQLDRNRLVVECSTPRVPEERQGQFRVQNFNPFVADAQFQVFLIWVRKFYDAGSLPLSTELGEHLHSIGFDETYYVILDVQRSSETSMVANLITVNAKGQVCTRLEGAEVTISKALNPLFART